MAATGMREEGISDWPAVRSLLEGPVDSMDKTRAVADAVLIGGDYCPALMDFLRANQHLLDRRRRKALRATIGKGKRPIYDRLQAP